MRPVASLSPSMTLEDLLVEQHAPLTRRLRRIVGCPDTAEDLRQEAYVRALRFAPRHEHPDRQRAWLHRTATNLALETAGESVARRVLGARIGVLSEHHQAIDRLGRGLRVSARSPEGVVESLEWPGRTMVLGPQWHPERRSEAGDRVGRALVAAALAP